jgi:hypothetical protein
MEKTFGMFKRKVLIFFQMNKYSIVLDVVMICIYLHNMCIANSNGFDTDKTLEIIRET